MPGPLQLPVSFGEAADKISILEIKSERIADKDQRANIQTELNLVLSSFPQGTRTNSEFLSFFAKLKAINEKLWDIENAIRACEHRGDFGPDFIRLARSVYLTNDERSAIKRQIEILFDSPIREEKSYAMSGPDEK